MLFLSLLAAWCLSGVDFAGRLISARQEVIREGMYIGVISVAVGPSQRFLPSTQRAVGSGAAPRLGAS